MAMDQARIVAPPASQGIPLAPTIRHGVAIGLLGAAAIAAWFLVLDWGRGRPLYTPTLLGTMLMHGSAATPFAEPRASLAPAALFTLAHVGVFVVLGVVTAWLVELLERRSHPLLELLLIFVLVQLAFIGLAVTFPVVSSGGLGLAESVVGNLLAATSMATYAWRRRPQPIAPEADLRPQARARE